MPKFRYNRDRYSRNVQKALVGTFLVIFSVTKLCCRRSLCLDDPIRLQFHTWK